MKRLFIRLTGLMVTAAIMLSAGGTALATEIDGQDNDTGVATTQPAEIPDTQEPAPAKEEAPAPAKEEAPAKDEAPAPADNPAPAEDSKAPAEDPAAPAEDPNAPADEPAGAPANDPAAPAEEPEAPAKDDKAPVDNTNSSGDTKVAVTLDHKESVKLSKDNDALAEDYFNHVFGTAKLTKRSSYNYAANLSGNSLAIYNYLNEKVAKVASGEITYTQFELPKIDFTAEDLGLSDLSDFDVAFDAAVSIYDASIKEAFNTVIKSNPYNLYWFSSERRWGYGAESDGTTFTLYISLAFVVSEEYRGANEYTVGNNYGALVNVAHKNALDIISQNASLDDYNKLKAYRDAICDLTDYNFPAAYPDDPEHEIPYGNPWQMIWVFDGDTSTTVVCEGYSKAFQFLCDNSTFQNNNIWALSVTGKMDGGAHMWNVVHMDDNNYYLVDVTNCDSLGRDVLFLRGRAGNSANMPGYKISLPNSSSVIVYEYDTDGSTQTPDIATSDYVYNSNPEPSAEPSFVASHGMVLAGEIGVKFIVDFPEGCDTTGCYVDFQISSGRTGRVNYSNSLVNTKNTSERYFIFFVNPLELADNITATLNYGNGKTAVNTYSAMAYIQYVRLNFANDPTRKELVDLIDSLYDYGYYMQKSGWGDGNTHTPIIAPARTIGDGEVMCTGMAVDSFTITKDIGNIGIIDSVKVGLTIASQTELRISVKLEPGVEIWGECTPKMIDNEQYYQFSEKNIGPKALGSDICFGIATNIGGGSISVSPMYYVKIALESGTLNWQQKYALAAYYYYYQAAMAYPES